MMTMIAHGRTWSTVTESALRSSLGVQLLLYHRLGRLRGGYGVGVTMHHLPGALFGPKDHRGPESPRGDLFASAYLGLAPLYLHYVGELRYYVLRYGFEACGIAIPERRCATVHGLGDLVVSPARGWGEGVVEGHVFSLGEVPLARLGVPSGELSLPQVESFEYFVETVYGSHLLGITSIVSPLSLRTLFVNPTLFSGVRGRGILGSRHSPGPIPMGISGSDLLLGGIIPTSPHNTERSGATS